MSRTQLLFEGFPFRTPFIGKGAKTFTALHPNTVLTKIVVVLLTNVLSLFNTKFKFKSFYQPLEKSFTGMREVLLLIYFL